MGFGSILVVDDSPTELRLITAPLRAQGYKVATARDGEEALRMVQSDRPDLIVLDIVMPNQNGFQVCRKLKRHPATKDIKIVFLSSKDQKTDRLWGLRQGADEYLIKPIDNGTLLTTIERLL